MQKINYYPDGASMSRKFAPHLVHADAHAQRQMSASGAGGGNKTPASKVHGGMDDYEPKKGDLGGYGKNSPNHPDVQRKLSELEQNNRMTSDRSAKPSPQKSPKKAPPQSKAWDDKKK